MDDLAEQLPDLVFVLVTPPGGDRPGGVELRRTPRNDVLLVAYSSIDKLVAACGSGQPWVQVTRDQLEDFCIEQGVSLVAFDAVLDLAPRYPDVDSREQPPLEPLEPVEQHDGYLYVPSRPVRAGQYVVELELQPNKADRPLLLAYTTPDLLTAGCGEFQPWVAIDADDLPEVVEQSGAHGVLFNPVLAEASRHTAPVQDWLSRSTVERD